MSYELMWTMLKCEVNKRHRNGPEFGRDLAGYFLNLMMRIEKEARS